MMARTMQIGACHEWDLKSFVMSRPPGKRRNNASCRPLPSNEKICNSSKILAKTKKMSICQTDTKEQGEIFSPLQKNTLNLRLLDTVLLTPFPRIVFDFHQAHEPHMRLLHPAQIAECQKPPPNRLQISAHVQALKNYSFLR